MLSLLGLTGVRDGGYGRWAGRPATTLWVAREILLVSSLLRIIVISLF